MGAAVARPEADCLFNNVSGFGHTLWVEKVEARPSGPIRLAVRAPDDPCSGLLHVIQSVGPLGLSTRLVVVGCLGGGIEMAEERLEIRLEIKPFVPDTVAIVEGRLESIVDEMVASGELGGLSVGGRPGLVFAQASPDQTLTLAIAVLSLICEVPQAWPHVKPFVERLWLRLRGTTRGEISIELAIGGRRVRVEGLHLGEGVEVSFDDYIVQLKRREEDD